MKCALLIAVVCAIALGPVSALRLTSLASKSKYVDCAASYTSCEACVAPQTESNGAKASPCHWNLEAGSCVSNGGRPAEKFCDGPTNSVTTKCNKCKKDWETYSKANAEKLAAQKVSETKLAAAKASGADIGMAGIAGFKGGMCRPTGTILKGVCVQKEKDCTGGRSVAKNTEQCEICCMLRPTAKSLVKSGDKCGTASGKCEACLKMDGCKYTKMNTCINFRSVAAGSGGTEAGYEGIQKDCADHVKSEKFRQANKMKDIEKKKAAKSATAPTAAAPAAAL